MSKAVLLEAYLFYKGEAVSKASLLKILGYDEDTLTSAVAALQEKLEGTALTIVETDSHLQLTTDSVVSSFLSAVRKDELKKDIGKAGAEVLSVVLYKQPITKSEIDKIRGVNSNLTLRSLLTRGLVERSQPQGSYGYVYQITPELLTHLGVRTQQELPSYAEIRDRIELFESGMQNTE